MEGLEFHWGDPAVQQDGNNMSSEIIESPVRGDIMVVIRIQKSLKAPLGAKLW